MKKTLICLAFVFLFALFLPKGVFAATIYSNSSTGDDTTGDGTSGAPYKTFHKAYTMAGSGDTIDLTGTFDWSNADETGDTSSSYSGYTLAKNLTINGQGATETFIQPASAAYTADRRIFTIGSGITVTVQNLTLRYGYFNTDNYGGTAISSTGNLTILNTMITENANPARFGGGALSIGGSGRFIMRNSTLYNNGKTDGYWRGYTGGMSISSTNTGNEITNCTFFDNRAEYNGAIYASNNARLTVTNSTFLNNWATVSGIDIHSYSGALVYLKNNIFADRATTAETNLSSQYLGGFSDQGYNIVETQTNGGFTNGVNGNLVGDQASLNISDTLALNSATNGVYTLALLADSVAINTGDPNDNANNGVSVPMSDERHFYRNGVTDMGAFEYNGISSYSRPTTQATNISFSSVAYGQMDVSWTNGDGMRRIVFMKEGNSGSASPVDSTTYTANAAFGSGTQIGSTGWYAVYAGAGTSVTVTGLNPGTDYIFQVFEYSGDSGEELYLTDTATDNPKSQATVNVSEPTTQASSISFSGVAYTSMNVSWSSGDGENRVVFMKQANSGTATPVDGTVYTASSTFGSGTQIGSTGWYCVYKGTGTSVSVSGLSAETDYIFQVFEYNGSGGYEDYLTSIATDNPNVQSSATVEEPTTQASEVSFSGVAYISMNVSWTNGNGAKRVVFAKQASTGTASPVDNATYTASSTFGSGTQIGSTGWYAVYDGTGTSVAISGLSVGSDYIFQVFEYNESGVIKNYNTNTGINNPLAQATSSVTEPTTQASSISFSGVGFAQFTVSWSAGDGENRAVFVKEASSGTATPIDSTTYTANTVLGSGTQIGSTGWYCVYKGTGTSVSVSNLSAETTYIAQVFEYNGPSGAEDYLVGTASDNPNTQATSVAPQGETFESGDFSTYSWSFGGNLNWAITSADKNTGTYSARSGAITHSQNTYMQVTLNVQAGDISYYRKVSSEGCCDYLRFYIDGVQKESISGNGSWGQSTYAVTAGTHTFKWYYYKDSSVSSYSDAGFVDDIIFPDLADETGPSVDAGSDQTKNSQFTQDATVTDDSTISTYLWSKESGPGIITFGSSDAEDTTISASEDGTYIIRLTATDEFSNSSYDEFTLVWDTASPSDPSFGVAAGTYDSVQAVSLSSAGSNAIYYTTDGTIPTTSSTLYSSPISVASSQTVKALAVDAAGNESSVSEAAYVINIDSDGPIISDILVTPSIDSAQISWTTNESASSNLSYGLSSNLGSVENDASLVTSHSVILNSLKSCATYYYKITSEDGNSNATSSSVRTLHTLGCTTSTISDGSGDPVETTGGSVSLSTDDGTATINAPSGYLSQTTTIQINKLNSASSPSAPSGNNLVGDNFFELLSIDGSGNLIESFENSVTFTISYGSSTESQYDETTLDVYKYVNGTWVAKNCTLDASANTLTCSLPSFSTYGVFGEQVTDDDEEDVEVNEVEYESDENSITIRWETNRKADSKVKYGVKKTNLNLKKSNHEEERKHKIVLKDLLPDTKYFFKIYSRKGDDNKDSSRVHSIKTKAGSEVKNEEKTENSSSEIILSGYSGDAVPKVCSYIVQKGDSLWSIAKEIYGDATAYPLIINNNKEKYPEIALGKLSLEEELSFNCNNQQLGLVEGAADNKKEEMPQEIEAQSESYWWNPLSWF